MVRIFIVLGIIAIIVGNVNAILHEKRIAKRIDDLDERLSVFDGGSQLLKKYVEHCNEVRTPDLESRLSNLEHLGLIRKYQNTESKDSTVEVG